MAVVSGVVVEMKDMSGVDCLLATLLSVVSTMEGQETDKHVLLSWFITLLHALDRVIKTPSR